MSRIVCRRAAGRAALAAVVIGATLASTGAPSPAGTVAVTTTFAPVSDARVEQAHPKSNYGTSSTLRVDKGSGSTVNSYLKFGVANLNGAVQSAHLRVRVLKNGSGNGSSLSATTHDTWSEKTITWNNAPAAGALLRTSPKLPADTWVDYDVTGYITGNGTYAFHLALTSGTDGADIASRQSSTNRPQLVVVTTRTTDTQPPTATITSPPAGETVSGTVQVRADASDDTGVTSATLLVDGAAVGTDTVAPYAFDIDTTTLADGAHVLRVQARDAAGNLGSSLDVPVAVDNIPEPPPPPPPAWRSGNAYGAGYMNFVRFHPSDPNRLLLNTDIGGLHLSTNGGTTWLTRGRNIADYVASVVWHPTLPNVAYALAGKGDPGSGGVMVSEDGGVSWRMDSTTPTGNSNNTPSGDGLPIPHPRSTGQVLAVDTANGFLYAGTYKQGLMRAPIGSGGDPGAWTTVALAPSGSTPYFIRGLALDDQDPTTVYVATYGSSAGLGTGHVYRVSQANTSSALTTEFTASPRNAEEVRTLAGHLYAVANDSGGAGVGAFRLATARTAGAASAWRRIAAGPSVSTVTYYGMELYKRGSTTTLWVTSDKAWRPSTDVAYKFMWRGTSTDDFDTDGSWAALPDKPTDTPNDIAGPHGTPDPFWAIAENNYAWPGKDPGYTASGITVSPTDPNTLVMAGQGGPWRTRDNGATWYPVPTGINILMQARVAVDPDIAWRVYVGSVDYRGFSSNDALVTARHIGVALKQAGAPNEAGDTWSVAVDTAASGSTKPVYYGMGERDINTFGQIWMDPDPTTPTTGWTQVLDPSVASGRRPIGLAVVRDPAAPATPILLAVLQGGGMYRKVGSGSWTTASGFTSPIINGFVFPQAVEFAWQPGWNKVYVYDRSSGLWRSDDFGLTWTKLYSSPDTGTNKQGFLAAHPTNQDIVYLATSAGVSVIANAGTAGAGGATLVSLGVPVGKPGPLAVGSDGRIYIATQAEGTGSVSHVYASALTSSGTGVQFPWNDVGDDLWRSAINSARELAVGRDGTLYAGSSGGIFVLDGGAAVG
ncbi:MAG TPA: DNRLRE domain-containing protein [Acidimicrobiia bacterium]